jgi:hypothetical protein
LDFEILVGKKRNTKHEKKERSFATLRMTLGASTTVDSKRKSRQDAGATKKKASHGGEAQLSME